MSDTVLNRLLHWALWGCEVLLLLEISMLVDACGIDLQLYLGM